MSTCLHAVHDGSSPCMCIAALGVDAPINAERAADGGARRGVCSRSLSPNPPSCAIGRLELASPEVPGLSVCDNALTGDGCSSWRLGSLMLPEDDQTRPFTSRSGFGAVCGRIATDDPAVRPMGGAHGFAAWSLQAASSVDATEGAKLPS